MERDDPQERFSDRVENYVKYRPSYPGEVLTLLEDACGLTSSSVVADIGSGTGMLTALFLQHGNEVFGVEPNAAMRAAAERLLGDYPGFTSIDGTAEDTTPPGESADFIVAGQAFHWFDRDRAKREFLRIGRVDAWTVLVWNDRLTEVTPFARAYEALLRRHALDYARVDHRNVTMEDIAGFFSPSVCRKASFPNTQVFDYDGLEGRLLSASYVPNRGDSRCAPMLDELRRLFAAHADDGLARFDYAVNVYYGRLTP